MRIFLMLIYSTWGNNFITNGSQSKTYKGGKLSLRLYKLLT